MESLEALKNAEFVSDSDLTLLTEPGPNAHETLKVTLQFVSTAPFSRYSRDVQVVQLDTVVHFAPQTEGQAPFAWSVEAEAEYRQCVDYYDSN